MIARHIALLLFPGAVVICCVTTVDLPSVPRCYYNVVIYCLNLFGGNVEQVLLLGDLILPLTPVGHGGVVHVGGYPVVRVGMFPPTLYLPLSYW